MRTELRNAAQRGAVIIHVALALMALLAFTAMVIDYGAMWVGRRQAQNAADAGALAGVISLLHDGGSTPAQRKARAILSARHWANNNGIYGQANSDANVDVTLSETGVSIPPCGENMGCVRVDVMRNMPDRTGTNRGAPIPTFLAPFMNILPTQQGVRATATARASPGNNVKCIIPFAVIDRWADNFDNQVDTAFFPNDGITSPGEAGWTPNDDYQPPTIPGGGTDVYIPPYNGNTNHNGWKLSTDLGRQLILKDGSPGNYSAGWANEIDLPDSTGSSDYRWNIENCNTQPVGIAQEDEPCNTVNEPIGCVSIKTGVSQGPTRGGVTTVYNYDPGARWDATLKTIVGGQGMNSPRIRPIVILDIDHYINQGCSGTTCIGKVANIIGFFVEGMCKDVASRGELEFPMCDDPNKDVVGRIVSLPGTFGTGAGTVEENASFINLVQLVR